MKLKENEDDNQSEKCQKRKRGTRQRKGYWKLNRAQDRRGLKLRSGCSREFDRRGTWKRARKSRSLDKQE